MAPLIVSAFRRPSSYLRMSAAAYILRVGYAAPAMKKKKFTFSVPGF